MGTQFRDYRGMNNMNAVFLTLTGLQPCQGLKISPLLPTFDENFPS